MKVGRGLRARDEMGIRINEFRISSLLVKVDEMIQDRFEPLLASNPQKPPFSYRGSITNLMKQLKWEWVLKWFSLGEVLGRRTWVKVIVPILLGRSGSLCGSNWKAGTHQAQSRRPLQIIFLLPRRNLSLGLTNWSPFPTQWGPYQAHPILSRNSRPLNCP